jgi:acyl-CoA-binding protein
MGNVKLMIITKSMYWSAWQQLTGKLQEALEKENTLITEETNKWKQRWREKHKERNN